MGALLTADGESVTASSRDECNSLSRFKALSLVDFTVSLVFLREFSMMVS